MGNLDYNTDVNDIFEFFEDEKLKPVDVNLKYGKCIFFDCLIYLDHQTKKSKGFAFVKFES